MKMPRTYQTLEYFIFNRISSLVDLDPEKQSSQGKELIALTELMEKYELFLFQIEHPVIPLGMCLVPINPTDDMLCDLMQWDSESGSSILPQYRKMLCRVMSVESVSWLSKTESTK